MGTHFQEYNQSFGMNYSIMNWNFFQIMNWIFFSNYELEFLSNVPFLVYLFHVIIFTSLISTVVWLLFCIR